jgi:hypothetical protein
MRALTPQLHNVDVNPFEALAGNSLRDAALLGLVAIVAGGVREELQRAFLLDRFERYLGPSWAGVVLLSTAFGLGHLLQGRDAAIATGAMGAFWAVIYLRRRAAWLHDEPRALQLARGADHRLRTSGHQGLKSQGLRPKAKARGQRLEARGSQWHTMSPSSIVLPMMAPRPAPAIVPIVFDPPGAITLPSTPPVIPPTMRPVVPSSRLQ